MLKIGAGPAEISQAISRYQLNTAFNISKNAAGLPSVPATRVGEPVPSLNDVKFGTGPCSNPLSAVSLDISSSAKQLNASMRAALAAGQDVSSVAK